MCIIAFIITVILLSSCYTQKKMVTQTVKANAVYPKKFVELISWLYPCTTTKKDTLVVTKDSLVELECPDNSQPQEYVINENGDTIFVVKTIKRLVKITIKTLEIRSLLEDSAKLKACALVIADKDLQIEKLNKKIAKKDWWLNVFRVGSLLFLLLLLILILRRKRSPLKAVK